MSKRNKWVPEDEPQEEETQEQPAPYTRPPTWVPDPDAARYAVSFALPIGVLVALLDSEHELADIAGATALGLIDAAGLTAIGAIVRAGIVDETAIRHKMAARWRASHNAGIGGGNRIK